MKYDRTRTDGVISVGKYRFECTSGSAPEQYEVYYGPRHVAYVRLRGGRLTAECPDLLCDMVYQHRFPNECQGEFHSEKSRCKHLTKIAKLIHAWRRSKKQEAKK